MLNLAHIQPPCPPGCVLILLLVLLFRAAPEACGSSQARGQIGAAGAGLHHSHRIMGSEPCLQHTPWLMAMPDP